MTAPAVAVKVTEREANTVKEAKKSLLTQRINEAIRNAPKPRIVSSEEQQILDTISKLSLQFEMGVIQKGTAAAQVLEEQLNLYAQQLQLIHQNLNK